MFFKIIDDSKSAVLLGLILDLISFCVEHHTYHMKNYLFRKDLLSRVLLLLKSRYFSVVLGMLYSCEYIYIYIYICIHCNNKSSINMYHI